jgi:thioredoxin reductase
VAAPIDIAIIGGGPYGLSIAAHLRERGAVFRIFGTPLQTWREHMPKGMALKSDGFASNLSAPGGPNSLGDYCARRDLPYHHTEIPVPLATFIDYGLDFQQRQVPSLEERTVTALDGAPDGFRLQLDNGEIIEARNVVVAIGITHFEHRPDALTGLPSDLASHSAAHHDLNAFRGRDVTVLGAGSSAVDLAALLHEAGASTRLVARGPQLLFSLEPDDGGASLWRQLRHPPSGIGPGLRSRFYTDAPGLFRRLPSCLRLKIVQRHLGPSSPWRLKQRVIGRVEVLLGYQLKSAQARNGRVQLTFETVGGVATLETDHVIAATGYRPDLRRLPFLDSHLRDKLRAVAHTPVLSAHFESSVPGAYFVGPIAANTFGPLMRFMHGSEFAARRICGRLAQVSH